MTPLTRQFDTAQYDPHWRTRTQPDEDENPFFDGDDYEEHMKFETRQDRFI